MVWGLALAGIIQELTVAKGARWISLVIYIVMGWVAVIGVVPMIDALGWRGFAWLLVGGVIYTAGTVFYIFDHKYRHWHGIWHLFVLAGSISHYLALLLYVA